MMSEEKKSIALVTLYYPTKKHITNIKNIGNQVDGLIVLDNSSSSNEYYFKDLKTVQYIFFGENMGLSQAFNNGLLCAENSLKKGDYVLFFDQDSEIEEEHVSCLLAEYERIKFHNYNIGCLGASYFNTSNFRIEIPRKKKKLLDNIWGVDNIITTSMLIEYDTLKKIGMWNNKIFLDAADWDICWRLKEKGYLCCLTQNVLMKHSVGEGEKKIGGIKLRVCKPIRDYYRTRDFLYLFLRKYTPLRAKISILFDVTIGNLLKIIFLEERMERIIFIASAWKDFFMRRYGAYGKN